HHAQGDRVHGTALSQGRQAHFQRNRILLQRDRGGAPDVRVLPRQDCDEAPRAGVMIAYWAVPYLLVAALPVIVMLSVLLGGCAMRTSADRVQPAQFYSDPNRRAGRELVSELDRREARAELRRIVEEAQR